MGTLRRWFKALTDIASFVIFFVMLIGVIYWGVMLSPNVAAQLGVSLFCILPALLIFNLYALLRTPLIVRPVETFFFLGAVVLLLLVSGTLNLSVFEERPFARLSWLLILILTSTAGFFTLTVLMGTALYNHNHYRLADQWYTSLLRFFPGEVTFWLYRANARRQLGQDQDALADYYEALNVAEGRTIDRKLPFAVAVDVSAVHGELGILNLKRGQYQKVISACTVALSKSRNTSSFFHWRALHTRILAHITLGNVSAAMTDLDTMRAIDSTEQTVHSCLKSLALACAGQFQDARALWRTVVIRDPRYNDPAFWDKQDWTPPMIELATQLKHS